MKYRADIDGLRAVAVLVVVGFHAGVPFLKGGFVGVDVFFVISGYLIAGIVAERQAAGDFSLGWFWERRIRRIFPALMAMLAGTSLLAWLLMLPRDLAAYARSLAATLVSGANVYFWRTSDYFDDAAVSKPLLHAWSLGVEEQFYIVFPLVMLLAARFAGGRVRTLLAAAAVASFALSLWQTGAQPVSAFYLPFARAWELLTGVLLALWRPVPPRPWMAHAAGGAGLAAIAVSAVAFSEATDWPGLAAVLPCLGAGLVILGRGGMANRLLAARPLVWIGLISYSLYLWHWPLLVFQRLVSPGPWQAAAAVALAFLLAALSLRYVERPFRHGRFLTRRRVFAGAAAAIATLGAFAGGVAAAKGAPQRFDARALKMAEFQERRSRGSYRIDTCFVSGDAPAGRFDRDPCVRRDPGRPDWLLIGDSHAAALWHGLSTANPGLNVMQATAAGCSLARGADDAERQGCRAMTSLVYDDLLAGPPPDGVVLAGRWREKDVVRVAETLDWLKARRIPVVLIGPAPQYDDDLPQLMVLSWRLNDPDLPARRLTAWPRGVEADLRRVAADKGVPYVSLFDLLCAGAGCRTLVDETTPLAWDYGHLTPEGSVYVARRLREAGLFPQRSSASTQSR